ncbi:hypothetical protein [Alkaliphilus peptidifermentans]|uniref:Homeodomain-like domain-containing protein n=1 Tax=Alkaliphilus peptidifermentans DSM 18978 TaxID=1120976 RepID=A0A1G5L2T9_9FIRM|nr:hypothetical protein [Alkaliphilus peptidifermentans]SCZ07202.1 hypothetical protein SAMN03080606_04005 [Alkaliphilus peptidifermentans DSM 18978]
MRKKIGEFIQERNNIAFTDVSFHDLIEMKEAGLTDSEIATELGISKNAVRAISDEINEDF